MIRIIAALRVQERLEKFGGGRIFQLPKSIFRLRADWSAITTSCIQAEIHISAEVTCLVLHVRSTISHARISMHVHE